MNKVICEFEFRQYNINDKHRNNFFMLESYSFDINECFIACIHSMVSLLNFTEKKKKTRMLLVVGRIYRCCGAVSLVLPIPGRESCNYSEQFQGRAFPQKDPLLIYIHCKLLRMLLHFYCPSKWGVERCPPHKRG